MPAHENDLVAMPTRQVLEQCRDDLDRMAFCIVHPAVIPGQLFDFFKLEIAFGIVLVGGTDGVGDCRDAAGNQHAHHH